MTEKWPVYNFKQALDAAEKILGKRPPEDWLKRGLKMRSGSNRPIFFHVWPFRAPQTYQRDGNTIVMTEGVKARADTFEAELLAYYEAFPPKWRRLEEASASEFLVPVGMSDADSEVEEDAMDWE